MRSGPDENRAETSAGQAKMATRDLIDPVRVRAWFNRWADRVSGGDFLLREVSERMLDRLAYIRLNPQRVLDLGCGDGADMAALRNRYPQAFLLGVDFAEAALKAAQQQSKAGEGGLGLGAIWRSIRVWQARLQNALARQQQATHPVAWVAGDATALPLASRAVDLIWSNGLLHWHNNPPEVFAECQRVLQVDGLLMFACFGPDSFKELRAACEAAAQGSAAQHALTFVDMHDLGDMLVHAGLATPVMDMERLTLTYATPEALLAEVRTLGGNVLKARPRGLSSSAYWQKVRAYLDGLRTVDGRIPLTIELVYGHAWKPQPKQTGDGRAIVQFHPNRPVRTNS